MATNTSSGAAKVTLPSDEEILITREFSAPPRLVFRAWTTPELVKRWWAGHRGTMTSVEIDLRVGGHWRHGMLTNGGIEIAFHGEFREIVPNERLVSTEAFESPEAADEDGDDVTLNTTTFTENNGHTVLELLVRAPSKQVRDAIIDSGMEGGMQEQMDLLDELVSSLR